MIFISRDRQDEHGKAIRPSQDWFALAENETKVAIEKNKPGSNEEYEIAEGVYRHIEVQKALEKLFHGKCAYCESQLEETGWNVEHYRPKGRVAESQDHPGYYWLAYRWENLLPSCIPCNQRRQDKPSWDDPIPGQTQGKLDQFPIADETKRATGPEADLKQEQPLLFNPCINDFKAEFHYNQFGQILEENQSQRLKETIRICHLTRSRLRKKRTLVIKRAAKFISTIRKYEQTQPEVAKEVRELFWDNLLGDNCYFAAVARYVDQHPERFGW